MNTTPELQRCEASYHCPVCGNGLPHSVAAPPFDAPCSECGLYLWCRRRDAADGVFLQALPGRSPEPLEVDQVVKSLVRDGCVGTVVLDLSLLETATSSLMARMIMMNRRIKASGGHLRVTGLQPVVRDIFERARLNMALDLAD